MQQHVASHLETVAILSLPNLEDDDKDDHNERANSNSADKNYAESRANDFDGEDLLKFTENDDTMKDTSTLTESEKRTLMMKLEAEAQRFRESSEYSSEARNEYIRRLVIQWRSVEVAEDSMTAKSPSSPLSSRGNELDFAATLAAGIEAAGFNPSTAIDDPIPLSDKEKALGEGHLELLTSHLMSVRSHASRLFSCTESGWQGSIHLQLSSRLDCDGRGEKAMKIQPIGALQFVLMLPADSSMSTHSREVMVQALEDDSNDLYDKRSIRRSQDSKARVHDRSIVSSPIRAPEVHSRLDIFPTTPENDTRSSQERKPQMELEPTPQPIVTSSSGMEARATQSSSDKPQGLLARFSRLSNVFKPSSSKVAAKPKPKEPYVVVNKRRLPRSDDRPVGIYYPPRAPTPPRSIPPQAEELTKLSSRPRPPNIAPIEHSQKRSPSDSGEPESTRRPRSLSPVSMYEVEKRAVWEKGRRQQEERVARQEQDARERAIRLERYERREGAREEAQRRIEFEERRRIESAERARRRVEQEDRERDRARDQARDQERGQARDQARARQKREDIERIRAAERARRLRVEDDRLAEEEGFDRLRGAGIPRRPRQEPAVRYGENLQDRGERFIQESIEMERRRASMAYDGYAGDGLRRRNSTDNVPRARYRDEGRRLSTLHVVSRSPVRSHEETSSALSPAELAPVITDAVDLDRASKSIDVGDLEGVSSPSPYETWLVPRI